MVCAQRFHRHWGLSVQQDVNENCKEWYQYFETIEEILAKAKTLMEDHKVVIQYLDSKLKKESNRATLLYRYESMIQQTLENKKIRTVIEVIQKELKHRDLMKMQSEKSKLQTIINEFQSLKELSVNNIWKEYKEAFK